MWYTDLESVRTVFMKKGFTDWELYNGKPRTRPKLETRPRFLIEESEGGTDLEGSWEDLSSVLDMIYAGGGNATLMLGPKEDAPKVIIPIKLSRKMSERGQQVMINGTAGGGVRSFDNTLNDKLRIYDLENEVAALKEGSGGPWARIGEVLLEKIDPNLIANVAMGFLSKTMGGASMGVSPDVGGSVAGVNESIPGDDPELDAIIDNLLGVLSSGFSSEQELKQFLISLTRTVKQNPSIVKQLNM